MVKIPLFLVILTGVLLCSWLPAMAKPKWFADAIWYQVFPERFCNGDRTNDPVRASLQDTWPYLIPADWQPSPWTSDWYELQTWEQDGRDFYVHAQLRRYGGDLQGILDKLDYLKKLGVNALYLNPIFESPSLHKYGATLYHHVDKHFGPAPAADLALFAKEDPADPATWKWSAADKLFLELIRQVHRRDMRIIIDGVFNHVGIPFWAFQKARREGPASLYAKWFDIHRWDDPTTPEDEFEYRGWAGVKGLPEFRKNARGPHPEAKRHMHAIVKRWMDPNGDGDPSDGIDGWRLDVAAEVPIAFWHELRGWVTEINPDAYLVGEIWWEDYRSHKLKNAGPWLEKAFDGVMNYRFTDAVLRFANEEHEPTPAVEFLDSLKRIEDDYGYSKVLEIQNLLDSHDVARLGSVVMNPEARLDHDANVKGKPDYRTGPPHKEARQKLKFMAALQFLLPGAPYIYYGSEAGMWGADDPDCRKPMLWPNTIYDDETFLPTQEKTSPVKVAFDVELHKFYQALCSLRRNRAVWRRGNFQILSTGERWFAFSRKLGTERAIVVVNAGKSSLRVPASRFISDGNTAYSLISPTHPRGVEPAADLIVDPLGIVILQAK